MVHNRLFCAQFRFNLNIKTNFRPQTSDGETISADHTDYAWDPECSHLLFLNKLNDISSAAIDTVSVHKDCLGVTPLTIDATPLIFNDKTSKKSLVSKFINRQETLR